MNPNDKQRISEKIVRKVSNNILYKLDAFERMCTKFHEARYKSKSNCVPKPEKDMHVNYAFEHFFYYCLEQWEKDNLTLKD